MTGETIRRWLHNVPLLHFAGALVALAYALASPLTAPHDHPDDTPFSRMYVAIAAILVAGGVAGAVAERLVRRSVFLPEIRALADDAGFRGAPSRPWSFNAVQIVMVAVLLLLAGEFTLLSQQQSEVGPWSWRAPMALALSEAIYLAWKFEGLALKTELQLVARRWDRLKRLPLPRPRHSIAAGPMVAAAGGTVIPAKAVMDEAWAEHIRELLTALSDHGLDIGKALPGTGVSRPLSSAPSGEGPRRA